MSIAKEGVYQNRPVISLMKDEDDKFPFSFGMGKAKLIIENIEYIKNFVEKNEKSKTST